MAFHVRTRSLNHSPQWYHDHCSAEDGGSPAFRAMLTADMKFVAADIDTTHTYAERVHTFEAKGDKTLRGKSGHADPVGLKEVLEREGALGYRPVELYSKRPFTTITRLMEKEGLSTTALGEFLKWKAKAENVKKARAAKAKKWKKTRKVDTTSAIRRFFKFKKEKRLMGEL